MEAKEKCLELKAEANYMCLSKSEKCATFFFDAEEDGSQPIRRLSAGDGLAERGLT